MSIKNKILVNIPNLGDTSIRWIGTSIRYQVGTTNCTLNFLEIIKNPY